MSETLSSLVCVSVCAPACVFSVDTCRARRGSLYSATLAVSIAQAVTLRARQSARASLLVRLRSSRRLRFFATEVLLGSAPNATLWAQMGRTHRSPLYLFIFNLFARHSIFVTALVTSLAVCGDSNASPPLSPLLSLHRPTNCASRLLTNSAPSATPSPQSTNCETPPAC